MEVFSSPLVKKLIELALLEDIPSGDITSELTVDADKQARGQFVAREEMVVCGLPMGELIVEESARDLCFQILAEEGSLAKPGHVIAEISGNARAILSLERTILNFLQRLSGIASTARKYSSESPELSLLDTRKTTPGWRVLEKYAVRVGGGRNHRANLSEMILIKDNHIIACGGDIKKTLKKVHAEKPSYMQVEIEVDTLEQLQDVLEVGADVVMLDNMNNEQIKEALALVERSKIKPLVEISGGVKPGRLKSLSECGVKRASMGALTSSISSVDIGLDFVFE